MKKISVIVPAYNEVHTITKSIESLLHCLRDNFHDSFELLVVDDGSEDGTYRRLFYNPNIVLLKHDKNLGKGEAIKTGVKYALGEYIAYLDADLELSPVHLYFFVKELDKSTNDVMIGSKLHRNSIIKYPWYRWITCIGYFSIVKLLFQMPIRDTQTGIKVFTAHSIRDCIEDVRSSRWAFDVELLYRLYRRGYGIGEQAVSVMPKRKSKVRLVDVWKTLKETLRIER